ncbi:MAG TPA: acyl carrier protein [Casimicrobiaceae bacterium]|nr:acyl carrier protein [Casimicrobiaceae bacterium]
MTDAALHAEVALVVRHVLRLPQGSEPIAREGTDAWDSLKHMEIVFALEDRYDIRFDEAEFDALDSVESIAAAVARHRAT